MSDEHDLPEEEELSAEQEGQEPPEKPGRPKGRRRARKPKKPERPRRRAVEVRDSRRLESMAAAAERPLPERLSGPGAILGAVLLVVWLLYGGYQGGLLRAGPLIVLLLSLALIGAWVGINLAALRGVAGRRGARSGAANAAMIVLVLGIVVFINFLSHQHHYLTDLTREGLWSLSKESINILKGIDQDVEVTLASGGSSSTMWQVEQADKLLQTYQYHLKRLKIDRVDLDRNPELKDELGISYPGKAVFKCGDRKEEVSITGDDEEAFTTAIYRVAKPEKDVVYFLQGHGELDPDGYGENACSQFKKGLQDVQLDAKKLTFAVRAPTPAGLPVGRPNPSGEDAAKGDEEKTQPGGSAQGPSNDDESSAQETERAEAVPADCKCLIIAGPTTTLHANETETIRKYLEQGGSLFAALSYQQHARLVLNALLSKYDVTARDGVVCDPVTGFDTLWINQGQTSDELLRNTVALDLLASVPLEVKETPPEPQQPYSPYSQQPPPSSPARALLSSRSPAWLEGNLAVPDPQGDPRGPFPVAAVVDTKKPKTPPPPGMPPDMQQEENKGPSTRLVVIGSALAIADALLKPRGGMGTSEWATEGRNLPFAVAAVTWLTHGKPISIPAKHPEQNYWRLEKGAQYLILTIILLVIPLGTVGTGVVVWWRRR